MTRYVVLGISPIEPIIEGCGGISPGGGDGIDGGTTLIEGTGI